jgi:hypothetical protein
MLDGTGICIDAQIPPTGMFFMIMGQRCAIATSMTHDHGKPNGCQGELSLGEANVPYDWSEDSPDSSARAASLSEDYAA